MHDRTIKELAAGLQAGDFTSVELTRHFLERIEALDGNLNSFITVTADTALEQARAADARIAAGDAGPLTGIPIAHKDIFCTDGVRTSCGSKMLDNFIAPYNATVVEKFDQAGLVVERTAHVAGGGGALAEADQQQGAQDHRGNAPSDPLPRR